MEKNLYEFGRVPIWPWLLAAAARWSTGVFESGDHGNLTGPRPERKLPNG